MRICPPPLTSLLSRPMAAVLLLTSVALAQAAPSSLTIHIGVPSNQESDSLSLIVMVVNRGKEESTGLVVTHSVPTGLTFLPEKSDRRCVRTDSETTVSCSLTGAGEGFSLQSGQSVSFALTFHMDECVSPAQNVTAVRTTTGEQVMERTTGIAFSCDQIRAQHGSIPTANDAAPSYQGTAEEPCIPFCTTQGNASSCKLICLSLATDPPLNNYLCASGRMASFHCTLFPRTLRDGAMPRSSCEYDCE